MKFHYNDNIVYIGGFDLPYNNAAAQRVLANSKIFRDMGLNVALYGLSRKISQPESFTHEGFSCCNLPYPKSLKQWYSYLTSIQQYVPFLERLHPKAVIAYNHPAIALQKLARYCKQKEIKIISDCTEWYEPSGDPIFKFIKEWDVNKRMYKVHNQLDGIIAISRYLDEFYQQRNIKTILLPPLVDLQEPKWKQKYSTDSQIIQLIYAGSTGNGSKDRIDMVIDALEEVSKHTAKDSFILNVIGITKEKYLQIFTQEKDTPSFVTFLGRIPHEKVIQMLLESDFQIFLRENHLANKAGFPTKFAESISSQTMVLTNPSSNIDDYMQEGINSFRLDISSPKDLIKSLSIPLKMTKQEIIEKRQKMDITVFDYRRFIPAMADFLSII